MSAASRLRETVAAVGPRVVTSSHRAASAAGIAMYARGGNAFDAALAACFVEHIALPMKCGLAGDLVALFRKGGGRLQALVSVGPGPAALAEGATMERLGPRAVGIPGAPSGYATLHGFATLTLDELIVPATHAADAGVPWSRVGLSYVQEAADLLRRYNDATPYMPGGKMPALGDMLHLPGLGALLRRFARYGADLFQHEDGERMLRRLRAAGGFLREVDLCQRPARLMAPTACLLDGVELVATPAPTGGTRLLPMVERAMRGDMSLVEIVRAERAETRRRGRLPSDGGTSVVTAADDAGNAVVVVHSNSFPQFGSGVVLDDGLVLSNRPGRGFDLAAPPGSANAPTAGLTPLTTLHAWAIRQGDLLTMGATPGGVNQIPWNLQSVTERLRGAAIEDIVSNPRWALNEQDELSAEPDAAVPAGIAIAKHLPAFSHRSVLQLLELPRMGLNKAAADPRAGATALASYG